MAWLEVLLMQYRQQYLRNSLGTELKIETVLEEHVLRPPLVAFLLCTKFFVRFFIHAVPTKASPVFLLCHK